MTANLQDTKTHIHYMKRRLRVGETPKQVQETSSSFSLKLGGNTDDSGNTNNTVQSNKASVKTPPTVASDTTLSVKAPVLRLNRRSSAIGSLALMNVEYVGWELKDGSTGYLYSSDEVEANAYSTSWKTGEEKPPLPEVRPASFRNRQLVEFHKGALVVGLRHFKNLKRLIAVPLLNESIYASTLSSPTVSLHYEDETALYISVVDSQLEFRREQYRGSIHETFGIGTYHPDRIDHADKSGTGANDLRALFGNN